ncbi:MAG: TraV family lipoprotein [Rhodospirillales bacterium]|nr:TraV family lipoprotein [Rhodospirillales bacterium]
MTQDIKRAPRRAVLAAATLATLLLAGCSSGNIGESWQCPLAAGGSCDSVAAVDPAVPDPAAARGKVLGEPLWQVRGTGQPVAPMPAAPCEAECGGDFDPFAWLALLFSAEAHEGEARSAEGSGEALAATTARPSDPMLGEEADALAVPPAAALPAEPAGTGDGPQADDLRTGEVVARIWIAPFVDADGVYREASHVRVVLEPAGWRLK